MSQRRLGYRTFILKLLENADAGIGDIIQVNKNGQIYEGILIPRSEYDDEEHLVIKLKSGYNIGIHITPSTQIVKIGVGAKPKFAAPPLPEQRFDLPKVTIVSTGGTIASRVDYRTGGVRPALSASDLYSVVPELAETAILEAEVLFTIVSEDMNAKYWSETAQNIAKHILKGIDGIVIPHGTDTMGYTAAALSFALQELPIPVVLVGSQRSADRPSSDAATNLTAAVAAVGKAPFAEVAVAMHETVSDKSIVIHRGTKVRKCHTSRRDAFQSVNSEPIARIEDDQIVMLTQDYLIRDQTRELVVKPDFNDKVALIKFYPGLNPQIIDFFVEKGYKGIVLEGTGLGHVCGDCLQSIRSAIKRDLLVGMTSQCIWGRVGMEVYSRGRDLLAAGVVPLEDMLAETALVKLMWVFGQTDNLEEAKKLMSMNIAREISSRTSV